jgi:hypothetical protein
MKSAMEDGWRRFLERLKQLWGKPQSSGAALG